MKGFPVPEGLPLFVYKAIKAAKEKHRDRLLTEEQLDMVIEMLVYAGTMAKASRPDPDEDE